MSFTPTVPQMIWLAPGLAMAIGTYTNTAGSTGGAIGTSLGTVISVQLTPDAAAVTNAHVYNETLPKAGPNPTVTIVTGANEAGSYSIIGSL